MESHWMRNTVMVPTGELVPGDVLDDGGLVIGWADPGMPYEKLKVLSAEGKLEHRAYGRYFNLVRRRREGE